MLAKGITLVESRRKVDVDSAQKILENVMSNTGNSIRLGISGIPGVGKSTFIETIGLKLIEDGHKVAVLAVDPSSPHSGGSILGDKTRMPELSKRVDAFIRPSATGGTLGGVARQTRESMMLCEAAGYDVILVETVGVGQSEVEVSSMVDFFVLLMLPGAGDSLQGIKKGIIEMADMLIVNKADGDNHQLAKRAKNEYEQALRLVSNKKSQIKLCSALTGDGISEIWKDVNMRLENNKAIGSFKNKRINQQYNWMIKMTEDSILQSFRENSQIKESIVAYKSQLEKGQITPVMASHKLLEIFRKY